MVSSAPPSSTPRTAQLTGVGATQLDPSQAVRNQLTNAIAVSDVEITVDSIFSMNSATATISGTTRS